VRGGLCPGDIGRRYGEHDKNFLLSAVKSAGGYLVFTDESGDTVETAVGISAHDPCAQTVTDPVQAIGSVVGNLLSTQFTLFDGGIDETTCPPKLLPLPPRKELGLVLYGHNVLGQVRHLHPTTPPHLTSPHLPHLLTLPLLTDLVEQAPRSLTVIVPRPTRRDDRCVLFAVMLMHGCLTGHAVKERQQWIMTQRRQKLPQLLCDKRR